MNRRKRTEILIKGNKEVINKIENEIKEIFEVKEVQDSEDGLAMIKVRDTAKGELFYLGEVLITEAKVYVNGQLGLGIVVGDNKELARSLALIDGAYKTKTKEIEKWDKLLLKEGEEIKAKELKESNRIMKTKVDFSTMNV